MTGKQIDLAKLSKKLVSLDGGNASDKNDNELERLIGIIILDAHKLSESYLQAALHSELRKIYSSDDMTRLSSLVNQLLDRIGFEVKYSLAKKWGVITGPEKAELIKLNTIRNEIIHLHSSDGLAISRTDLLKNRDAYSRLAIEVVNLLSSKVYDGRLNIELNEVT